MLNYRYVGWPVIRTIIRLRRERTFGSFGAYSTVTAPRWLINPKRIHIGDATTIYPGARLEVVAVSEHESVRGSIRIGSKVQMGDFCHIAAASDLVIEDAAGIGSHSLIIDHDHTLPEPGRPIMDGPLVVSPVRICRGAWVGEGAKILKGVTVGAGAIVAAGAVVVKDVEAGDVVGGVPARSLKSRPPSAGAAAQLPSDPPHTSEL